jgi:hypothetical protein
MWVGSYKLRVFNNRVLKDIFRRSVEEKKKEAKKLRRRRN